MAALNLEPIVCLVAALSKLPSGKPEEETCSDSQSTTPPLPTIAHHRPPSRHLVLPNPVCATVVVRGRMCACNCCFAPDKVCAPCFISSVPVAVASGFGQHLLLATWRAWVEPPLGSKGQLIPLVGLLQVKQLTFSPSGSLGR